MRSPRGKRLVVAVLVFCAGLAVMTSSWHLAKTEERQRFVRRCVDGLRAADPAVRVAAAQALGEVGPSAEPAEPALDAALADPDAGVRAAAAEALRRIRNRIK
ncbi:MAG: HEAT repeat domain-containing protein [Planctomycetes bacterium]|nr:HEAT repeat domain-containing protein [Planctomycetota bacterium]